MLKFFRKIRQGLLEKGKFQQYVLYAFGEILLVVIGILIALQINNWNQDKKDRESERYFLSQLVLEIDEDILALEQENNRLQNQLPAIENLLVVLNKEPLTKEDFNRSVINYINTCWYAMAFKSNSATFEEMKSSGKLGLIKDKKLRNRVVIFYNAMANLENVFIEANEFGRPHVIDMALKKGFVKYLKYQKATFSKYYSDETLYEMRKYKDELINQAANQNWDVFEIKPIIDNHLEKMKNISSEIKNHLN